MGKINVAFIGCGRIADLHYRGYQNHRHAQLYALCDTNPEILALRQQEWQPVKVYSDYQELLQDREIDAVEILTPQALHEPMVIAALQSGKHVAVQKPMTTSLASADRMLAAAAGKSLVYKVTENYVFYPPIQLARQLIDDGQIGEPSNLRIKFISGSSGGWAVPTSSWEWRMGEILAGRGTATFDHGHHLWSTAWYLMGEVERVGGWIENYQGVVDCPAIVIWKYRDGRRYGSCDFTHAGDLHIPSQYYANDEWIEVSGSRGIIFIRRCTGNIQPGPVVSLFNGQSMRHWDIDSDWGAGFRGATENFIQSIRGRETPLLNGAQGREILRFALAVRKAADLRREVYLAELDHWWPALYSWQQKRQRNDGIGINANSLLAWVANRFSPNEDLAPYAPQARALTEKLLADFDPDKAKGWDIIIGIHLTPEGEASEEKIGLTIKDQKIALQFGTLPTTTTFTVRVAAGVWAAILLKKKRPELAFLQGKIKVEGRVEEGLKLRELFKL
jgi:predicted dehydrogenase/putative sterol carrier protein